MPKLLSLALGIGLGAVLLPACSEPPASRPDGFAQDTDVRITGLSNGDTVERPFLLPYTAGADVRRVRVDADGELAVAATPVADDGSGELIVNLVEGRHTVRLVGLDGQDGELSTHQITLRVVETPTPWVTITSPSDGATLDNPVHLAVTASDGVDRIELFADDWSLGTVAPGELLTWDATGTGYLRSVEARAWDDDADPDTPVASDRIALTISPGTDPLDSDFNAAVMDVVATYPTDGSYGYWWPSTGDWAGTPNDIWYQGELVAEGDPEHRSYCSGITFETFMRAWTEVDREWGGDGSINGMTVADLTDFRIDWYVRDLLGDGVGVAIEGYGLGERVTDWRDLQPGDFVQIWRYSGSGHTFVFVDWITDGDTGSIIGMRYWSSQGSTDGIGEHEEYFGVGGSDLDPAYFYAARVYDPVDWLP